MIYNIKCIFGLQPVSGIELLNPWNFLSGESDKAVFYSVNEVTFGSNAAHGLTDKD